MAPSPPKTEHTSLRCLDQSLRLAKAGLRRVLYGLLLWGGFRVIGFVWLKLERRCTGLGFGPGLLNGVLGLRVKGCSRNEHRASGGVEEQCSEQAMNGISGTQPKHRILAYDQTFGLLKVCFRRRIRTDLLKSWKTYPCRRLVHPFRLVGLPFTLRPGRGGQREQLVLNWV